MTEKTLSWRIQEDGISATAKMIAPAGEGRYEWDVTLYRPDGRSMRLHDYSGPDEPGALDVLGALLSVASRVKGTDSYEEWASEFAADPKDWQDRETYALQRAETGKLRDFLGAESLEAYLHDTEMDD